MTGQNRLSRVSMRSIVGMTLIMAMALSSLACSNDRAAEVDNDRLPTVDIEQLAMGRFAYRTFLLVEETRMEIDTELQLSLPVASNGQELLIESRTDTGIGVTLDQLSLDAGNMRPIRREVRQNDGHMQVRYSAENVSGQMRSGEDIVGIDVDLDEPSFAGEAGLEATLATLPLAEGYRVRLRAVEVDVQTLVRQFEIEVEAAESIEVPAGTFMAFPVRLRALDGQGGDQWLWYSQDTPRYLVRAEGELPEELGVGLLITELMALDID